MKHQAKHGQNHSNKLKIDLFGFHAVREAWLNPGRCIHALYITEQAWSTFDPVLKEAQAKGLRRPSPVITDKGAFDHVLPPGTVHQGIGVNCQPLDEVGVHDLIIRASAKPKSILVILDQVTDPHNVGAILRSASAFGADGVILQRKHAPELTGILAKTASGAVDHIPVAYETNLSRAIEELKENEYFAVGLDERGERTITQCPDYARCVLVLGAEGPGLRPLVRDHCDILLRLPTSGAIQSLNVSNAAAVALYALGASRL